MKKIAILILVPKCLWSHYENEYPHFMFSFTNKTV